MICSKSASTLTHWRLETTDSDDAIVVRVTGLDSNGREIITAPLVERLPARQVLTADGKVWVLGKRDVQC